MIRSDFNPGASFDRNFTIPDDNLNRCGQQCFADNSACGDIGICEHTNPIENIPEPLRGSKRWVCFQIIRQPDGSTKKIPLKINGAPARSDHPEDWSTLPEVLKAIDFSIGSYPAIALGADYPLRVLDLDGCIDTVGNLSQLAKDVLAASQGCYIERSVSGRGLHVLVWAESKVPCHPCPGLEVYGGAPRFVVMTGDLWGHP